jgi:Spy/CpxP family protein refolding chaperone
MIEKSSSKLKIWMVLVGVFLLGSITGAALDNLFRLRAGNEQRTRGFHRMEKYFDKLQQDLNLTEEQAAKFRTILEETRNEYRMLRSQVQPQYEQVRNRAQERIRELLTPEQQKQFDTIIAEREAKHRERKRPNSKDQ